MSKANFAWASIAGADPEAVELIERDGRKGVLTAGCADPFWLDDEAAGVVIRARLRRPKNLATPQQREAREAKYQAGKDAAHSWRGAR